MAIIPEVTGLTRPYWENARAGTLVIQRCQRCANSWHPPLPCCPHCHSSDLGWQRVSGAGTVYTYTVVTHATHAALADHIPYVIAIVELAEGPRLVTGITGCEPGDVRVGLPVRVRFEAVTDEVSLPYFEPASTTLTPDEAGETRDRSEESPVAGSIVTLIAGDRRMTAEAVSHGTS